jgi:valyl-tRNA synthetase
LEQDLKVTPAHDMNDKTLGEAQPWIIDIFNEDATMNSFGLHYQGKIVLWFVKK